MNTLKRFKEMKPKIISHLMAFVTLNVVAAITSYFVSGDYKYSVFYGAGLFQVDFAKFLEKKLKLK